MQTLLERQPHFGFCLCQLSGYFVGFTLIHVDLLFRWHIHLRIGSEEPRGNTLQSCCTPANNGIANHIGGEEYYYECGQIQFNKEDAFSLHFISFHALGWDVCLLYIKLSYSHFPQHLVKKNDQSLSIGLEGFRWTIPLGEKEKSMTWLII